jgi:hypothetical protein
MQAAIALYPEREILESRFCADIKVYREAVARLGSCPPDEFDQVYAASEMARLFVERAYSRVKDHIVEDECGDN